MTKFHNALLVIATLALCPAWAQTNASSASSEDSMLMLRQQLMGDKKQLVASYMDLSETEAKAFWPVYADYQNELFLLQSRSIKLIKDFAEVYQKMTDSDAKKLLDEYLAIEGLRLKVRQAYLPKFRKVLSEKKVARYYQIENKIHALLTYELAKQIPLVNVSK